MPYLAPYGGISWQISCLLPPSSISLFATILMKMEVSPCALPLESGPLLGALLQTVHSCGKVVVVPESESLSFPSNLAPSCSLVSRLAVAPRAP